MSGLLNTFLDPLKFVYIWVSDRANKINVVFEAAFLLLRTATTRVLGFPCLEFSLADLALFKGSRIVFLWTGVRTHSTALPHSGVATQ